MGSGVLDRASAFLGSETPRAALRTTILPGFIDTNRQANVKVRGVTLPNHRHRHRHGPQGWGRTRGALGRAQSRGERQVPDTGWGALWPYVPKKGQARGHFLVPYTWGLLVSSGEYCRV